MKALVYKKTRSLVFEEVNKPIAGNDESLIKLEGNPGTCLIIDSFRNYHKGGFCEKKLWISKYIVSQKFQAKRCKNCSC